MQAPRAAAQPGRPAGRLRGRHGHAQSQQRPRCQQSGEATLDNVELSCNLIRKFNRDIGTVAPAPLHVSSCLGKKLRSFCARLPGHPRGGLHACDHVLMSVYLSFLFYIVGVTGD